MKPITLTRHEFSSSELLGLARKERRPWIRRRIQAIAAIECGKFSREAVARKYGTDSDQVRLWIKRYNSGGLAGLEDKPGRGAKRRLSRRREAALKKALTTTPRKSGIATNLWSGRAVREFLKKRRWWFSCSIAETYVLLRRLGFTLQRPGLTPLEADPNAEARFLKELRGKKRGIS
jgi:transposase